jgi:nucleotide-binding universal stress UspA family protein
MSIKTILVAASGGTATEGAIEVAGRFARRFDAHLEGFHAKPDPQDLYTYDDGGLGRSMAAEFVDQFRTDTAALAGKTKSVFEAAIARHSIALTTAPSNALPPKNMASAVWREETGYGPALVARRARFFDLAVLGRSERVIDLPHTDAIEQTLLHSGRPVLLAPAYAPDEVGDSIVIGWDGSPAAVRALAAAMPFLATARSNLIVTVGDQHRESAAAAVDYLGWHDIAAMHRHVPNASWGGSGQQLLAAALHEKADLLVMGGYGHTPWREYFFGGATRDVVGASLLPFLLSH